MNLWLRLIWMLLTVRWRRPVNLLDTAVVPFRVLPNDLDLNGHVNNGRYFTLSDIGRMDFVLRSGAARVAWRRRAKPIVGEAMAKFRKDLKLFERYEMHTRLLGWDEKWAFMEHRFVRGGRVAGVVVMRGLFLAPGGGLPPAQLLTELGMSPESPPLPDWVRDWSAGCDKMAAALRAEEQPQLAA